MAWKMFVSHHVAHLQPTVTTSTSVTGYPASNVRTTDPNTRWRTSPNVGVIVLDWDRGHTDGSAVGAALVLGSNAASDWEVRHGVSFPAGGSLGTNTDQVRNSYLELSSTSSLQHLRVLWDAAADPCEIGLVSIGVIYSVADTGPQIRTQRGQAIPSTDTSPLHPFQGTQRVTRSFRKVTRANADSILEACSNYYIENTAGDEIDGFGGGGGQVPIALIDTGTSPATIYYGRSRVSVAPWAANYSEVFVDMEQINIGGFF